MYDSLMTGKFRALHENDERAKISQDPNTMFSTFSEALRWPRNPKEVSLTKPGRGSWRTCEGHNRDHESLNRRPSKVNGV